MENRRNYYRILHVQPDAPPEVIRTSFKTLMQTLKAHPDLGGEHWNATLINEAYNVLRDPKKREVYNQELLKVLQNDGPFADKHTTSTKDVPSLRAIAHYCAFCKTPYKALPKKTPDAPQHCKTCDSPLDCEHKQAQANQESDWGHAHRANERFSLGGKVKYYVYWPSEPGVARIADASVTGLRLLLERLLFRGQVLKIENEFLSGTAVVRHVKPLRDDTFSYSIGVEFLDVEFTRDDGTFISTDV